MFSVNGTILFNTPPRRECPCWTVQNRRGFSWGCIGPDGRSAVLAFTQRTDAFLCARAIEVSFVDLRTPLPMLDLESHRDALDSAFDVPEVLKRKLHTLAVAPHDSIDAAQQRFSDHDLDVLLVRKVVKRPDTLKLNFSGILLKASPDLMLTRMYFENRYLN